MAPDLKPLCDVCDKCYPCECKSCVIGWHRERAAAVGRRKDAKLDHVVISERWDKKAAKFTTPELPFPFKSKDAYERSIRQPLGKDFNTDSAFRCVVLCPTVSIQHQIYTTQEPDAPSGAQDTWRGDPACAI